MTRIVLTVAVPEAMRDDATNLGLCLGWISGWKPKEWDDCFSIQWQDASGNLFRVMSMEVRADFAMGFSSAEPLERPADDVEPYIVNMAAANRARDALEIWQGVGPIPQASTAKITAIVGMSGVDALTAMGLEPMPNEL